MERKRSIDTMPKRPPSGAAVFREDKTDALTRAFVTEWARTGYAALSLEAVAKRAGVGKAALYRRWPSKLALVADRFQALALEVGQPVDTGSLRTDIRAMLMSLRRVLRHPMIRRILPDLHAEMPRSPDLAALIRNGLQTERRRRFGVLLMNAVARGELPADCDLELATDLVAALVYWRIIVIGGRADVAYIDRLTGVILAGLTASQSAVAGSSPRR